MLLEKKSPTPSTVVPGVAACWAQSGTGRRHVLSAPCLDGNTDIEDKNREEKRDLGEMWVKYERLVFFLSFFLFFM